MSCTCKSQAIEGEKAAAGFFGHVSFLPDRSRPGLWAFFGGLVFGKSFVLYHRSGFHFPRVAPRLCVGTVGAIIALLACYSTALEAMADARDAGE